MHMVPSLVIKSPTVKNRWNSLWSAVTLWQDHSLQLQFLCLRAVRTSLDSSLALDSRLGCTSRSPGGDYHFQKLGPHLRHVAPQTFGKADGLPKCLEPKEKHAPSVPLDVA